MEREQWKENKGKKLREERKGRKRRKGKGWHEQFRMMSQKRKQVGSLAQIQEIGTVGEPFNYRLHDIIKTEETDQETVDGIISRVYAPGLLYQGQVIKKAQVCVYKK
ncbi:MAG: nucleotide exchange factor GrpE [Prevotella sp.]|nr:nucleotide exchange factor GrpE [Prevotella sp.]